MSQTQRRFIPSKAQGWFLLPGLYCDTAEHNTRRLAPIFFIIPESFEMIKCSVCYHNPPRPPSFP